VPELFANRVLWTAVVANILGQVIKMIIVLRRTGRLDVTRFFEAGGMPSSHAATLTALAYGIGKHTGWGTDLFALTAVVTWVVVYDAANVRRAAGQHAEHINILVTQLPHLFERDAPSRELKTLLGHTYAQVGWGIVLGLAVGWVSFHWR